MIPRLTLHLSLVVLVVLWRADTAVGTTPTTLTVNLTDMEGRNMEFIGATRTCSVLFIFPSDFTIIEQNLTESCMSANGVKNCTVDSSNREGVYATFDSGNSAETFYFNITFNTSRDIGCSEYIPNLSFISGQMSVNITCTPVFACDTSSFEIETVKWWRLESQERLQEFLDSPVEQDYEEIPPSTEENTPLRTRNITLEIQLTAEVYQVVGYYVTTFHLLGGDTLPVNSFIVYSNPVFAKSSGDQELIFGSDEAKNFDSVFCRFESFPFSTMKWESPSGSNFSTSDVGELLVISDTNDDNPDRTLGGQLVFREVQYEDAGKYRCIAVNSLSNVNASRTLRLRVRDPLRPLWPALGIIASLLITFLFIGGGALVDRLRGKSGVDDDDGAFQRNYSVVSNLGEESAEARRARKHHPAGKRVSITQQELLSDPH